MKIHGNARSPEKPRADRVAGLEQVVARGGGRGRRRERADGLEVGARYRRPVDGAAGSLLGATDGPASDGGGAGEAIAALRRLRMTAAEIAMCLGMALSTVSAVLTRIGLGKLSRLEPPEPANRYQRQRAGELLHIDVKKLGRILAAAGTFTGRGPGRHHGKGRGGWSSSMFRRRRDAARLRRSAGRRASNHGARFLAAPSRSTAPRHPRRTSDDRQRLRLPLDRARVRLQRLGISHLRTQPYRPRTNGKAERFIRTMLGGWAYGAFYGSTAKRRRP